ncbi:MAG: AAA family ATPase [Acidimicrobiales bacterium]
MTAEPTICMASYGETYIEVGADADRLSAVASDRSAGGQTLEVLELGVVQMSQVAPERIDWLWPGRIPRGKLTILEGDPKVGKSTLMLDIAARVTTGTPFPDGHRPAAGVVLILTAEDGLADTVRPRLDAADAAAERVIAWESVAVLDDEGLPNGMRPPSIPRDLDSLEALIVRHYVTLVVVDVLNAYLGADVDGHKDQDVRRALMPLAKLAERTSCAIVVLRHLNKSTSGPSLYRGGGSIGIAGAARSILVAAFDPDDEERRRRVLASQGSNVAETPPSLAYELEPDEEHGCARVRWIGESAQVAGSLLTAGNDEERSALTEAVDVLADILSNGPVPAKEAERRAGDEGVHQRTLRRAKDRLGVRSVKSSAGRWEWVLPPKEDGHAEGGYGQAPTVGPLGHLPADQDVCDAQDGHPEQGCPRWPR